MGCWFRGRACARPSGKSCGSGCRVEGGAGDGAGAEGVAGVAEEVSVLMPA